MTTRLRGFDPRRGSIGVSIFGDTGRAVLNYADAFSINPDTAIEQLLSRALAGISTLPTLSAPAPLPQALATPLPSVTSPAPPPDSDAQQTRAVLDGLGMRPVRPAADQCQHQSMATAGGGTAKDDAAQTRATLTSLGIYPGHPGREKAEAGCAEREAVCETREVGSDGG